MRDAKERRKDEGKDLMQQIHVVHTISGGLTLPGTSNNSRKNQARKILKLATGQDVFRVSRGSREYPRSAQIIFTEDDAYNTVQPHHDPMVITVQIANCRVHRILVDTGSSVDILFKGALKKLNLKNPCYNSCTTPLYGFTGDSVMPIGTHILPVIIGEAPLQQNIMTEFIVVDTPSAYNAILGMPFYQAGGNKAAAQSRRRKYLFKLVSSSILEGGHLAASQGRRHDRRVPRQATARQVQPKESAVKVNRARRVHAAGN
ncbi:hypothetical protein LWI29_015951 [Acer saccharum]|uniref:Peptidase A2 domain-containing protein n=1 Tax=Acer saccharum TaxID=4024 RepID=A0AA39S5E3_ACESA|nr:hypothetical protein LWI29_015951 [Acer saccharum]